MIARQTFARDEANRRTTRIEYDGEVYDGVEVSSDPGLVVWDMHLTVAGGWTAEFLGENVK